MGLDSGGGVLKFNFNDSIEDCANNDEDNKQRHAPARRMACGNIEDKRVMSVDYS
jgi:hypothetical protein